MRELVDQLSSLSSGCWPTSSWACVWLKRGTIEVYLFFGYFFFEKRDTMEVYFFWLFFPRKARHDRGVPFFGYFFAEKRDTIELYLFLAIFFS